jgi:peptidoglycan/LPS O-acetylase OafA/YrhL
MTGDIPKFEKHHLIALDSLRGVAALSVVFYHIDWNNPLYSLGYVQNSYLMVDFFFVLSGFVIALNYNNRIVDLISTARFMWLRFWRLYPLHFALLIVFLVFEIVKWIAHVRFGIEKSNPAFGVNDVWAFFSNLFLVQAFDLQSDITFNGPAWSISVEFYTYLVFALVVLITRRVMLAAVIISMASALVLLAIGTKGLDYTYDFGFVRCLMGFFLGVLSYGAYRALHKKIDLRISSAADIRQISAVVAIITIFTVIALLSVKPSANYDFALPLLAAVLVTSVAMAPDIGLSIFLRMRPIVWLGTVSYSIYMVHGVVVLLTDEIVHHVLKIPPASLPLDSHVPAFMTGNITGGILVIITVTMVLVLSHFTFTYIEAPFRDWSKKALLRRPEPEISH